MLRQAQFLLRAVRGLSPASYSPSGGFLEMLALLWFIEASPGLCLHLHIAFSLCASVSKFPPLTRTPVILTSS